MTWLAFDIGCLECGEASEVIGVFESKIEAEEAIAAWTDNSHNWGREGRGGSHSEQLFEIRLPASADIS